jgi:hypothetical protein
MTALRDVQQTFLGDLYTGSRKSLPFIHPSHHNRLSVYQNNTLLGLTDILKNAFPVVAQLVGDDFFKTLAHHYAQKYPLTSGNRHTFGEGLPLFLTTFDPASSLPYLPAMAALEWALFQSEIAPDAAPVTFADLTPETLANPDFTLSLHPSVRVISVDYNILDLWRAHQQEVQGTLTLEKNPHDLLISRNMRDDVTVQIITPALRDFLMACVQGDPLASALEKTLTQHPHAGETLQESFAAAITLGIFNIKHPSRSPL